VISLRAGHFEIVVLKFVDVDDGVKDICNFMRFVDARALQTRLGVSVFSQKRQGKKDATMFSNVRRVPGCLDVAGKMERMVVLDVRRG
jgi:hypothetical protein